MIFLVTLSSPTLLYTFYKYFGINLYQSATKTADANTMNLTFVGSHNGTEWSSSSRMIISSRWFYLVCGLIFCVVSTFLIFKREQASTAAARSNKEIAVEVTRGEPLQPTTSSPDVILSPEPTSSAITGNSRSRLLQRRQRGKHLRLAMPVRYSVSSGREDHVEIQGTTNSMVPQIARHNSDATSSQPFHSEELTLFNPEEPSMNLENHRDRTKSMDGKRSILAHDAEDPESQRAEDGLAGTIRDDKQTTGTLGIYQTYLCMWDIVRLRPILLYIGLLFVFSV